VPPRYGPGGLLDEHEKKTGVLHFGWGMAPRVCARLAEEIDGRADLSDLVARGRLEDFVAARAHHACDQDILVTTSPWLLSHRSEGPVPEAAPLARGVERWVAETNPRTPSEAARIVGLFLRARRDYTYWTDGHGATITLAGRGDFYWLLAHRRLPRMWRYRSACAAASAIRRDGTLGLGQSVYDRCVRALEARDAIGEQFYVPETEDSFDAQGYHFDYLLLLLSGALDAQARVARRAYNIGTYKDELSLNFRKHGFLDQLDKAGAHRLYALVTGQWERGVMTLISKLRNEIHAAGLSRRVLLHQSGAWPSPWQGPRTSFFGVPKPEIAALQAAAEACGGLDRWGLMWQGDSLVFDAYTYATVVVEETLRLVDAVADATDVEGLFPAETPVPPLEARPAKDAAYDEDTLQRIDTLG